MGKNYENKYVIRLIMNRGVLLLLYRHIIIFFPQKLYEDKLEYELLVVINGTTDQTPTIVLQLQKTMPHLYMLDIPEGGKGLAIREGFKNALERDNDLMG